MNKKTLSIDIGTLLETSTAGQLTSTTSVFFGPDRKRKSAQVQLNKVQYIQAEGGILLVKAESRSSDKTYETSIQFTDVNFVAPGTMHSIPLEMPGREISIMPLRNMGNDVQVHCECMDFYWRFAMYNNRDKSLIGEPPAPYVKKTNRVPLNPDKVPGACKHLTKLVEHLKLERILK